MTITRKINDKINSDPTIIDLRMQAEDLINAMEQMTDEKYQELAQEISQSIDLRISQILEQNL